MNKKKDSASQTFIHTTLWNNARQAYKRRGLYYIICTGIRMALNWPKNRFWFWYYKTFKSSETFEFQGKSYHYLFHPYNTSWKNERAVNVPIVWEIVKRNREQGKRILEVGNFLSYVFDVNHEILDKYDAANGVINEDVVDFNPSKEYDLIVSILTLQCVGWDESPRDPLKVLHAIENLKRLLSPGGQMIVTIGLGYNTELDKLLRNGIVQFDEQYYLKKISNYKWEQVKWEDIKDVKYDNSIPTSVGVVVGVFNKK
jgi:SAM-dependent methyltransferase